MTEITWPLTPYYIRRFHIQKIDSFLKMFQMSLAATQVDSAFEELVISIFLFRYGFQE